MLVLGRCIWRVNRPAILVTHLVNWAPASKRDPALQNKQESNKGRHLYEFCPHMCTLISLLTHIHTHTHKYPHSHTYAHRYTESIGGVRERIFITSSKSSIYCEQNHANKISNTRATKITVRIRKQNTAHLKLSFKSEGEN